jgi:hypothetical protein
MIYRWKAYQILKLLCFGSFPKFCTFLKLIQKLIIRFSRLLVFSESIFIAVFIIVYRNDAYDIPLDS